MRDATHRAPVVSGKEYTARWHGSKRTSADIKLAVVHTAEVPPGRAKALSRLAHTWDNKVSWHFAGDDDCIVRCLPDDVVSWTAPPCNDEGLHFELCAYAKWSKLEWFKHQAMLKRAAWQFARWSIKHDIPARWLTDEQLRKGEKGFVTHAQINRVFKQSDHWDPGPNFPKGYFLLLVKRRIDWLKTGQ